MRRILVIFLFFTTASNFPQTKSPIVSNLQVSIDKERNDAKISWDPPSKTSRIVIARSNQVINTVEKALVADSLGKYYTGKSEDTDIAISNFRDVNLTPGVYYYAILDVDEVYKRKVTLLAGKNYTTKPLVVKPKKQGSFKNQNSNSSPKGKNQTNPQQPYPQFLFPAPMAYYDNRDYNGNRSPAYNPKRTSPSQAYRKYPKNQYKYGEMHVRNISYTFSNTSGEILLKWDAPENADESVSYTIYQSNGPLSGGISSFFRNGVSKIVTVSYPYKYVMLSPKKIGSFYFGVTVKRNGHENFDLLEKESYILVDAIRDSEKEVRSLSSKLNYQKNRIFLQWLPPENAEQTVSYRVYQSTKPLDEGKSSFNKRVLNVGYVKYPSRKISVDLPEKGGKYYYGVTVLRNDKEYYDLHINRSYIATDINPKNMKNNYIGDSGQSREVTTERNIINERNIVTEQKNNIVTQSNVISEIQSLMQKQKNLTFEQAREIVERRREQAAKLKKEEKKKKLYADELIRMGRNNRLKVRELVDLAFVPKKNSGINELINKHKVRNQRKGVVDELLFTEKQKKYKPAPELLKAQKALAKKVPVEELLKAQKALSYLTADELLKAEKKFKGKPASELLKAQAAFKNLPAEELLKVDKVFSKIPAEELLKAQKVFLGGEVQELLRAENKPLLGLPAEELLKAQKALSYLTADELLKAEKVFRGKSASELLKAQALLKGLTAEELLKVDKIFSKIPAEELLKAQKVLSTISSSELFKAQKIFQGKPAIELFIAQKRMNSEKKPITELMRPQDGRRYSKSSELLLRKKYPKNWSKANTPELVRRRQYSANKNRSGNADSLVGKSYGDIPDPNAYLIKPREEDEYSPKPFYREEKKAPKPPKKRYFRRPKPTKSKKINNQIDAIIRDLFLQKKYQQAVNMFRKFNTSGLDSLTKGKVNFYLGLCYYNLKKYQEALNYLISKEAKLYNKGRALFWEKRSLAKLSG